MNGRRGVGSIPFPSFLGSWMVVGGEYTCRTHRKLRLCHENEVCKVNATLGEGRGRASERARHVLAVKFDFGRGRRTNFLVLFLTSLLLPPFQMRPASFPARWGPRSRPRATTAGGSAARSAATSGWPAARAAAAA